MAVPDPIAERLRTAGSVFAEEEAALLREHAADEEHLAELVARRVVGEPIQHVVGWAEFLDHRIEVDPGVFVPRMRSELLAREAIAIARAGATVVDLCCGAAALGVVVARAVPEVQLHVADSDPAAVACAARNVAELGSAYEGDLFDALPTALRGAVDLLVVNAPYVPTAELELMPAEARLHEATIALDGGRDGLDVHRRVALEATEWLAPGAVLLIEASERQAPVSAALFAAEGLDVRIARDDELDATVVIAARPRG